MIRGGSLDVVGETRKSEGEVQREGEEVAETEIYYFTLRATATAAVVVLRCVAESWI